MPNKIKTQGGVGAPVCSFETPEEVSCLFNICKCLVLNFCIEKEDDGPPGPPDNGGPPNKD
ncbi:hypothetical protein [Thermohalobacter berrensis]|uniref:Uncharacterized protein n=1 Tax=Thermohalobacter berrensis TaxID=99594 RepID=A0A419SWA4_9FIRM|nr:hypothetical protein [Thermohalobacter berrensis]RKD29506.1 hypothetical protein BET03_05450 [Thermohalobacter berrensis]